jgi:hypothetical protein
MHVQENNLAKDTVDTLHQVHGEVCTNDGSVCDIGWYTWMMTTWHSESALQWTTMNCHKKVEAIIKDGCIVMETDTVAQLLILDTMLCKRHDLWESLP